MVSRFDLYVIISIRILKCVGISMNNDCVFCYRKKLEKRIVGENDNFLVVPTFGQISNGGYLLLIPKQHISCLGDMNRQQMEQCVSAIEEVQLAIQGEYKLSPITLFEHGIAGQTVKHAHLHFVPEICHLTERIKKDFPENEIQQIYFWQELRSLYQKRKEPYLFWLGADAKMNVCWNPEAPPQYLRIVVAEAVGRPERGNWRDMDTELDERLISETVERFKSLFSSWRDK
ncbi:MAG: HIT family protein [Patescibacteria group bacterium]